MKIKQRIPTIILTILIGLIGILAISNQTPSTLSAETDEVQVYLPIVLNETEEGQPTYTPTATGTATPVPDACPVRFEGTAVAGNTHVLITGDIGTTVTIIDIDTGKSLGAATLLAIPDRACPGFADFIAPLHNPLNTALVEGHLLLASSDDGSFDEIFVTGVIATPTMTHTPTNTPTNTPSKAYITVSPSCSNDSSSTLTVQGFNWPPDEDIALYWDTNQFQEMILKQNHNGTFSSDPWIINGMIEGTYVIRAISQNGMGATTEFVVPCDVDPTATPTSTPAMADLVIIGAPQLISTPPINAYESVDFTVVISNAGEIDINQQFFVDLYFEPTDVFTNYIPITQSVGFSAISALQGGESQVITITAPFGFENSPDGSMVYGSVDSLNGDSGGQIIEPIESNNVSQSAAINNIVPQSTPTTTPTPDTSGFEPLAGIVQSRIIAWVPQERARIFLISNSSDIIGTTESDQNGYYVFNNVPANTYTIVSCIEIDGIGYYGFRSGIIPPNPAAHVYMLPGTCAVNDIINNELPTVTHPGNQENNVGDTVSLQIVATDSDGPSALTYSQAGLPTGLSINATSGLISGTLPQDSQALYNVSINVYDGQDTTSITIEWAVTYLTLETLIVSNVSSSGWTTATLNNSYTSMVAVCTVNYNNNTVPQVVRMQNATAGSFQIRLQNPSGQSLNGENVHCMVMEEGVWELPDGRFIEAQKYSSTITDGNNNWNGQAQSYGQSYITPVVLGQVMTYNDADWSTFWSRGTSRQSPPTGSTLFTGKHVGTDSDTTRANETIGFIVIEQGSGEIEGIHYEVRLGADIISGVGEDGTTSYTYNFVSSFSGTPVVGVLSQMGVDGNEGGFAVLMGTTPFTSSSFMLAIEEEQLTDAERNHTTEQVGYFVFNAHVFLDGTEP